MTDNSNAINNNSTDLLSTAAMGIDAGNATMTTHELGDIGDSSEVTVTITTPPRFDDSIQQTLGNRCSSDRFAKFASWCLPLVLAFIAVLTNVF